VYRLEIGKTEEAYRFRYFGKKGNPTTENNNNNNNNGKESRRTSNIIRGVYSPYLAIYSTKKLNTDSIYNIYLEKNTNTN